MCLLYYTGICSADFAAYSITVRCCTPHKIEKGKTDRKFHKLNKWLKYITQCPCTLIQPVCVWVCRCTQCLEVCLICSSVYFGAHKYQSHNLNTMCFSTSTFIHLAYSVLIAEWRNTFRNSNYSKSEFQ